MLMCFANVLYAFHFVICLSLGIVNISVYMSIKFMHLFSRRGGVWYKYPFYYLTIHRVRGAINTDRYTDPDHMYMEQTRLLSEVLV